MAVADRVADGDDVGSIEPLSGVMLVGEDCGFGLQRGVPLRPDGADPPSQILRLAGQPIESLPGLTAVQEQNGIERRTEAEAASDARGIDVAFLYDGQLFDAPADQVLFHVVMRRNATGKWCG